MVKQVRDYRAKSCEEFSLFGEIRQAQSFRIAVCELSRFLAQFSAKFLNKAVNTFSICLQTLSFFVQVRRINFHNIKLATNLRIRLILSLIIIHKMPQNLRTEEVKQNWHTNDKFSCISAGVKTKMKFNLT